MSIEEIVETEYASIEEAIEDIVKLKRALHYQITRPAGIVCPSAEEFYDQDFYEKERMKNETN